MARRKTDAERGRFGAWAYSTRDALGLSPEQVMSMLPTHYHPATLRKIEGGSTPIPPRRIWRELDNLYATLADERHVPIDAQPSIAPQPTGTTDSADPLVSALLRQTEAIEALVAELRLSRAEQIESTDALLRAMAAVVGGPAPGGTSADSEPAAHAGTGR